MEIKRDKLLKIFLYTLVFWIFAHGYRFMNHLFIGDSFVEVFQDDIYYQRSIGRFMQPLVMIFRGVICAPWLIGCISVVLFALSFYFISELLKIDNWLYLVAMCGILICNMTMTSASAAFLPWVDVYGVALLLAVLGVCFFFKDKWWAYLVGIVLLICAMGFYQAYIDVAFALTAIAFLGRLASGEKLKSIWKQLGKMLVGFALAGAGYWCTYKAVLAIHKVAEASNYNSLSDVGDYSGVSFGRLIVDTYENFFIFLCDAGKFVSTIILNVRISSVWSKLMVICFIASFVALVVTLVLLNKNNQTPIASVLFQIVILAVFPFVANFVNVMSKGMEHVLMAYSVFFFYVLLIHALDINSADVSRLSVICVLPLLLLVWNNIVYSNQVYFKIEMPDEAALSYATRLVSQIESMEDYDPGITPVAFVGNPEYSQLAGQVDYYRDLDVYGTSGSKTAFVRGLSLQKYLQVYLNVNMNVVYEAIPGEVYDEMPDYPKKGSMEYYGDVLVVKLSE